MASKQKLLLGDSYKLIKDRPDNSIDLIVTDPPYKIKKTIAGGESELAKSIQKMNNELKHENITKGIDVKILDDFIRIMKKPNIYIWCNAEQIPMYIDFFVNKHNCKMDILIWQKTNAAPTFNNKYLTDKEYCLYFRKGGFCQPRIYSDAKTVYTQPINIADKKIYKHPTIKPLNIIKTIISNSARAGDVVYDPFMGSGTTGVACKELDLDFIGTELNEKWFKVAQERILDTAVSSINNNQTTIYDFFKN